MSDQDTDAVAERVALEAGFEHLAAEAAAIEGGPPIPGTPEAAQSEAATLATTQAELFQALGMARMLVAPMFRWWPSFGDTWGDNTLNGIAAGGAAVMFKHGWTMGDLFAEWGPYLALAGATIPPSLVTYAAIKQQKAAHAAAQQRQQKQQPGQPDVSDSQATH